MMNGSPFVIYALSQLRQQEIERKARDAWRYGTTPQSPAPDRRRTHPVALDTVAEGC
jgi:hypothetical protein